MMFWHQLYLIFNLKNYYQMSYIITRMENSLQITLHNIKQINMTQPCFLQMRVDPPDLIRSLINTYTQNLQRENSLFVSDLVQIELALARHSQKLNAIQQMKNDKKLKQNILFQLQFKELNKKFPNILGDQKQKNSIQKQKPQTNENKSFHMRTIKKNSQPKSLFKQKNNNLTIKNKSKEKEKNFYTNKDQACILEKENNGLSTKSPYFRKQLTKNYLKSPEQDQIYKINKSKHLRRSSAQLIFADQNCQNIPGSKLQSLKKNMQKIRFSNQEQQPYKKDQSFVIKSSSKQKDITNIDNPYHHSKFKKELDSYKLAYDEAPSSNRGKVVQARESFNKTIK